ncbi:MAG: hypothetical protein PHY03_04460 [Dehalococcoidia bacterium]|nr:hypothetical protein [Dehalococcoidia bacterium]
MKKIVFLSLALLLLLVLIPGCFTIQTPVTNPAQPVGTPPVIVAFSNNPSTINAGGTSTLLWNVTGATSVYIDQGIGQVAVAGTRVVSPAKSTVYTISATNSAGTVIRSSAIIIVSAPAPTPPTTASNPVISFTASHLGGTSWQLNWNVSNATQIVIQPDIGPVNPTGSVVVTIPSGQTKLYRLEAVNDWGWAYWQVVMGSS